MKSVLCLLFALCVSSACFAQTPSPAPIATPAAAAVVVPADAAPPQWLQDVIAGSEKLPTIGPIIAKGVLYLGSLGALVSLLLVFLLSAINIIASVVNFAGLSDFAAKLQAFKDGNLVYWLKYISFFNAQK